MIRIALADDRALAREGLRSILGLHADMEVVLSAEDGHQLLRELPGLPCDVVVLDVSMPGPGFIETLHRLATVAPEARVLVLSGSPERQYALRALRAGALGYLQKDIDPATIVEGVRQVATGRRYVTPTLAEILVEGLAGNPTRPAHEDLSDREFEVLRLLGQGLSTKEVGKRLHISDKTVATYRSRIYEKLEIQGMARLVRYAVENGLTADAAVT